MALKVGELFASFNLDTSGIGSALNGAEKSLSNAGKSLAVGGAAMTAAVTAPLVAAGKDIAKKGSDFDAQMSKVFAIAGDEVTGSAEAMEKLRAKALEMGSTTQFTASEAGEAFEYMAMAGWKTENMLAAIEPLMNLAAAAGADLGTTSDIVTDAMTAFGLKATDMMTVVKDGVQMSVPAVEYFADILAATSTNANTNVTMLGESFKYVAPLAGSFGYSLNDVSLALGLMANSGIKSTMAGTSLSRVIQNMTKPSKETKEAMSALGLSLYDAKGQMKPLRDVMNDFRGVAKKNGVDVAKLSNDVAKLSDKLEKGEITEKQYEKELEKLTGGSGDFMKYVTQIAGARGLPGLLAIMNASQEDFDKLAKSIDNATGSSKKMKDVMLDNMQGDLTIFKSAVEGLEITLWDLVKEPMRGLIQRGTQIVDSFRNMDKSTQKGALKMAAFAAAIGPAMTAAGGLLTVLPKIRKVLMALASPVGLVSISLLALGAAAMDADNLMGQNLEKMAATAKTKLQSLQKNLLGKHLVLSGRANKFLGSIQRAITDALPGIIDATSALLQTGLAALKDVLPEAAKTATTMVSALASGIARNAPTLTKTLAGTLTSLATSVISAVPDMLDAGVTLFTALIDSLGQVNWSEIGTKINTAVTGALSEIKTNFYKLVFGKEPTEDDLGDWGPLGAKLVENIKAGIKKASDNGKNLLGGLVLGSDYDPGDTWGEVAVKIWNKITGKMGEYINNAGELIKGMVLGSDYKPDETTWGAVAVKIWRIIQEKFKALKTGAKNLIGNLVLGNDYKPDTTSWGAIAVKIWKIIQDKFAALKQNVKSLIGELALGSNYTPETTWAQIGEKIWGVIKSGFTVAGDWIKQLILGETYTPEASWSTVGSAIWGAIKAGFVATGDWIKRLVLGNEYTPEATWSVVGKKIWGQIKTGISETGDWLKTKLGYTPGDTWSTVGRGIWTKIKSGISDTGDWLKTKLGYTASDDWKTVGSGILTKIKEGIGTAKDFADSILEKIGTVSIDVEKVKAVVTNAGTFVTNLVGQMLAGKIEWANKITGVATSIAEQLKGFDWAGVGADLGTAASNLIRGMIDMIPNAVDAAGKALDLGTELASGIMDSIVAGIKTIAAQGVGNKLGTVASDLLHGILTGIKDFATNTDVIAFVHNLGEGFKAVMGQLGEMAGTIIQSILSPEGISIIWDAGISVAKLLLGGIGSMISGAGSFIENLMLSMFKPLTDWLENTLKNAGLLGEEKLPTIKIGDQSVDVGYVQFDIENTGKAKQLLAATVANYMTGGIDSVISEQMQRNLTAVVQEGSNMLGFDLNSFVSRLIGNIINSGKSNDAAGIKKIFEEKFDAIGIDIRGIVDDAFYESLVGFWKPDENGRGTFDSAVFDQAWALLAESLFNTETAKETAEEAAAKSAEAAKEAAIEEITAQFGNNSDVAKGAAEIVKAAEENMNQFAKGGFVKALSDGKQPAQEKSLEVSDAVVQQFMLTMSTDNGYLIGENFVLALGSGMSGQTDSLRQTAVTVATAGYTSIGQTASRPMGYSIGSNFGQGFVNGIRSKIADAARAAAELGAAGTNGLSDSIAEGSPSKITAMSGTNFGLGFVNSILRMADQATDAARIMGSDALAALDYAGRDMGRTAIAQTDVQQRSAYTRTAEATREAHAGAGVEEMTERIIGALEKVGVYIDGEEAGHLLTRYISEEIAQGASARR